MKPWFWLSAQKAHDLAPFALKALAAFRDPTTYVWRPKKWRSLQFANPLGIAGGVDKDGALIEEWWTFGPGFLEIGTVTPEPQGPNPGKIMGRDLKAQALWNKMGFPGSGANTVRSHLDDLPNPKLTPVFVNIGKNRTTPNELAARDYAKCMSTLAGFADAFVINISSPNTSGLRELLQPTFFESFLREVLIARKKTKTPHTPLLLKISPDLEDKDLVSVIETAHRLGIDGFIATNTTLHRETNSPFPQEGGVSGRPLADRSKTALKRIIEILGSHRGDTLIVSVGGVMSPDDVLERLDMGADLVQVYSALIFEGPQFFEKTFLAAQSR